jgi:hypothetical protein
MPDGIRWVGLDVHARESTFAVFDQATGEVSTKRVGGRPHELLPVSAEDQAGLRLGRGPYRRVKPGHAAGRRRPDPGATPSLALADYRVRPRRR